MNRSRAISVAVVLVTVYLALSALPVSALQTNTAVGSIHTNDTDFNNAQLDNMTVVGSGASATVELSDRQYDVVSDSGDGVDESTRSFVGDQGTDSLFHSEVKTIANTSGDVDQLTVNIADVTGSDYGFTVDVYAVQEDPDQVYGEGVLVKQDWDPNFSTGPQTFNLDTPVSVASGETWTFEFVTSGSDNDGTADHIVIGTDEDGGFSTVWFTNPFVTVQGGANLTATFAREDAEYVGQNHSAENTVQGFVDLSEVVNESVCVTWETSDGGPFSTLNQTCGITTASNHSFTWPEEPNSTVRVTVTAESTGDDPAFVMDDEGVLFTNHEPKIDNSSASPTGTLNEAQQTLSIDVNDTEFATAQGDSLSVEFFVDGSSVGTDTLTSNGTAQVSHTFTGGDHTWHAVASDSYGLSNTSDTFSVTTPSNLSIRTERPEHNLITSCTGQVTFYETVEESPTIVNRSDTDNDGKISLSGLPVGTQFAVQVSCDGYHNRTILLDSIFEQQSVFLINTSANTVENRLLIEDRTGDFRPEETQIVVEKAINESLYGEGSQFNWTVVAGDNAAADGSFTTDLIVDDRYRIVVQNDEGDRRILGSHVPTSTGTFTLQVGRVVLDPEGGDQPAYEATRTNESGEPVRVNFEYNDSLNNTTTIWLEIFEYNNESNVLLANTSFDGPFGTLSHTEDVPASQNETTWVVKFTAERTGGDTITGRVIVGPQRSVLTDMAPWLVAVIFTGCIWMVAGLFSQLNGHIGGIVVAGLGAIFYFLNFVPQTLGSGVMVLSLITGGIIFIRERRGGGL